MTISVAEYTVRCFRRLGSGELRHGVWVMTQESGRKGIFFHGDRNETQAPRYTVEELSKWAARGGGFMEVEELSPREVLAELETWPEAQEEAKQIIARHCKEPQP